MIVSRIEPISVSYGLGIEELDQEGRVVCAEFENFYLVDVYTPNAGEGLKRLDFRVKWDIAFADYIKRLIRLSRFSYAETSTWPELRMISGMEEFQRLDPLDLLRKKDLGLNEV